MTNLHHNNEANQKAVQAIMMESPLHKVCFPSLIIDEHKEMPSNIKDALNSISPKSKPAISGNGERLKRLDEVF